MTSRERPERPLTLVIGGSVAMLYAAGALLGCLAILVSLLDGDHGLRQSSAETAMVMAAVGVVITGFGVFCVVRALNGQAWAVTLVVVGLLVAMVLGLGLTVMTFQADEGGLLSSGWFWLALTAFTLVPIVLLSVAAARLPSPHQSSGVDLR